MGKIKRRFASALLASFLLLTIAPSGGVGLAYSDTAGSWAEEIVQKAGEYGLMNGYPDGSFGIGNFITRSEFVTVVCRMMGWQEVSPTVPTFIDCDPAHWAFSAVETAAAHGVTDPGGAFRPDDYISRTEMAEMLVRALGYEHLAMTLDHAETPFSDVTKDKGYISIAHDLGIINGVTGSGQRLFLPYQSAPREQAAAMLVRCYERLMSSTDWFHGFYAFSSFSQLSYASEMDGVSAGWARLEYTDGVAALNDTSANNNEWVRPEGAEQVVDQLRQEKVPLNLSVFSSASDFAAMMEDGGQAQALGLLTDAAQDYAGLTIDFEGLKEERRDQFTAFLTALRQALPKDKTLMVCVQPDDWFKGYDYRALGEVCDKVIMMAHDYQWASIPDYYLGTTETYCPVTPFDKVYNALKDVTDPDTGVQDLSRVALAISFNTTGFHVDEQGLLLDQTFYHPSRDTIAARLRQPDSVRTWDEISHNPRLDYTNEEGEHYTLWYEDAQSVADKLQLARMFGITGVSVWRLGTIPDFESIPDYDVWSVLLSS